jgi:hypothetical protein
VCLSCRVFFSGLDLVTALNAVAQAFVIAEDLQVVHAAKQPGDPCGNVATSCSIHDRHNMVNSYFFGAFAIKVKPAAYRALEVYSPEVFTML